MDRKLIDPTQPSSLLLINFPARIFFLRDTVEITFIREGEFLSYSVKNLRNLEDFVGAIIQLHRNPSSKKDR